MWQNVYRKIAQSNYSFHTNYDNILLLSDN